MLAFACLSAFVHLNNKKTRKGANTMTSTTKTSINWLEEVEKRKAALVKDTQGVLRIKSILDESTAGNYAPFGKGIQHALEYILNMATKDGFTVKNVEGYAGHIEFGKGEELIGILGHVDVVPEGAGWETDPFGAEIIDGKIFARGSVDDKGPMMAAYYGLKIIQELGLELNKRVRIILGTDEESRWRCVGRYFETEEMPTSGFSPDADFPIINAEKGLRDTHLTFTGAASEGSDFRVVSFTAGERLNMVPDRAVAIVEVVAGHVAEIKEAFTTYCESASLPHEVQVSGNQLTLIVHGVSAHGSMPYLGVNAGVKLASFIAGYSQHPYFSFIKKYVVDNEEGEQFGIDYRDEITDELTINYGIFSFSADTPCIIGMNMRYPVTFDFAANMEKLAKFMSEHHFSVTEIKHMKPHHVDADSEIVKTLQKVYGDQVGEEATLHSIGGATYARALTQGVAFGPAFPGREDRVHQKNEYLSIDDLVKITAIYAQSIYELAK